MHPTPEYILDTIKAQNPEVTWDNFKPTNVRAHEIITSISNEKKNIKDGMGFIHSFEVTCLQEAVLAYNRFSSQVNDNKTAPVDEDKFERIIDKTKPVYVNVKFTKWD